MRESRFYRPLFFAAIAISLLSLAPAMAHLLELARKLQLSRDAYFTVQQIYNGWALFGVVLAAQLAALAGLAIFAWRQPGGFGLVCCAIAGLAGAQILFWTYTYPANVATQNWTAIPQDWESLRRDWEYSHAAGALAQLAGFLCLIGAALRRR